MYIEFKDGQKYPSMGAEISDSCDGFKNAGYIIKEDELIIDIDDLNKTQIDSFIKYFEIKTQIVKTDRGIHLYYKKPRGIWKKAQGVTPCGFNVEYKQTKDPYQPKSITIKRNGLKRTVLNEGVRDELPDFLRPSTKRDIVYTNFLKPVLDEGDGRNNALYKHGKQIANIKEKRTIINFINRYLFAKPLSDKEVANILESAQESDKGAEDEAMFTKMLIEKFNIKRYKRRLWYWDVNKYTELPSDSDALHWITRYVPFGKKPKFYKNIFELIEMYAPAEVEPYEGFIVTTTNGYIKDAQFVPIITKEFTPYHLDIEYKEDAEPVEEIDAYLTHITQGEVEYQKVIGELLGYCLMTGTIKGNGNLCKFFLIVGGGGNGKGTLLSIIRAILGNKNCTSTKIHDLPNDRHLLPMVGSLANLGDDIIDKSVDSQAMATLKNLTSCDSVSVRPLFKDTEVHRITATQVFTSNHKVPFSEYGDSLSRRLMMLPMYAKVVDKDPRFVDKLTTQRALEYWLRLAMEGYIRLYTTGKFTESDTIELFNSTEIENGNPAIEFIEHLTREDILDKQVSTISQSFKMYCEANDLKVNIQQLKDAISERFELKEKRVTIDGAYGRFYVDPVERAKGKK